MHVIVKRSQYEAASCAIARKLYLRDLACGVRPHHGRYLGHRKSNYLMQYLLIARSVTKEDATPHPLSLTVILDRPKSSRRT